MPKRSFCILLNKSTMLWVMFFRRKKTVLYGVRILTGVLRTGLHVDQDRIPDGPAQIFEVDLFKNLFCYDQGLAYRYPGRDGWLVSFTG